MQTSSEIKNKIFFDTFKSNNFNWNIQENKIFNEKFFQTLIDQNIYFDFSNNFLNNIAFSKDNILLYIKYTLKYIDTKYSKQYLDLFLNLIIFRSKDFNTKFKRNFYIENILNASWLLEFSKLTNIESYIFIIYNKIKDIFIFFEFINIISSNIFVTERFFTTYAKKLKSSDLINCLFKEKPSLTFFKIYKNNNISLKNLLRSEYYTYTSTELYSIANILGYDNFDNYFKKNYYIPNIKIIINNDIYSNELLTNKQFYYFQKLLKKFKVII